MDNRFDAYLFDLDGTLLHTLPDLVVVTNTALEQNGFPPHSQAEILSYVGNGGYALARQACPESASSEQVENVFASFKALYSEIGLDLTERFPGMDEALAALKESGKKLAIFSNKFDQGVKDVEARFFPGVFDAAHGEGGEVRRKPAPDGLLLCARELGVDPARCAYFGDSDTDMIAAHAAGMFAVACRWGYQDPALLASGNPDAVIERPEDILDL